VLTVSAFATGIVALASWVAWGFVAETPLLDPRMFANRAFSTAASRVRSRDLRSG
jgi:hypothetical protein